MALGNLASIWALQQAAQDLKTFFIFIWRLGMIWRIIWQVKKRFQPFQTTMKSCNSYFKVWKGMIWNNLLTFGTFESFGYHSSSFANNIASVIFIAIFCSQGKSWCALNLNRRWMELLTDFFVIMLKIIEMIFPIDFRPNYWNTVTYEIFIAPNIVSKLKDNFYFR